MLRSLTVRDYALIEELEVDFDAGLNVITGETGAGKSILIGALEMILGERASSDVIRSGAGRAVIEGVFDEAGDPGLVHVLTDRGIEPGPVVILRREITSGYSRGFINDTPAPMHVMREVASHLIDLHGQHEHQSLLDVASHVLLLDDFGGLHELGASYRTRYDAVAHLLGEYRELQSRRREMAQQKEVLGFQIDEIDRVGPTEGEEEELENERRVLENTGRLFTSTSELYALLYGSDGAIVDRLVEVRNELQELSRIDAAFDGVLGEIDSARIVTSEAATFLQKYNASVEFNPERLEEIRRRIGEIDHLKRKYGGTLAAVLAHRREIGAAHAAAQDFESALEALAERIRAAQAALSETAHALSRRRMEEAQRVEVGVEAECTRLGMPDTKFEVIFTVQEDPDGWIHSDGSRIAAFESGMDRVEFYISTNVGEAPRPLARVASGGEISRVMLALKTILARNARFPILVFDEIDAGISGGVASKVGQSLHELARSHQIIAITHLPQIAARGDVHFLVEKFVEDGRARTHIRRLSDDHRAHHVAGLMSGATVSDAALESAKELLRRET